MCVGVGWGGGEVGGCLFVYFLRLFISSFRYQTFEHKHPNNDGTVRILTN